MHRPAHKLPRFVELNAARRWSVKGDHLALHDGSGAVRPRRRRGLEAVAPPFRT